MRTAVFSSTGMPPSCLPFVFRRLHDLYGGIIRTANTSFSPEPTDRLEENTGFGVQQSCSLLGNVYPLREKKSEFRNYEAGVMLVAIFQCNME